MKHFTFGIKFVYHSVFYKKLVYVILKEHVCSIEKDYIFHLRLFYAGLRL